MQDLLFSEGLFPASKVHSWAITNVSKPSYSILSVLQSGVLTWLSVPCDAADDRAVLVSSCDLMVPSDLAPSLQVRTLACAIASKGPSQSSELRLISLVYPRDQHGTSGARFSRLVRCRFDIRQSATIGGIHVVEFDPIFDLLPMPKFQSLLDIVGSGAVLNASLGTVGIINAWQWSSGRLILLIGGGGGGGRALLLCGSVGDGGATRLVCLDSLQVSASGQIELCPHVGMVYGYARDTCVPGTEGWGGAALGALDLGSASACEPFIYSIANGTGGPVSFLFPSFDDDGFVKGISLATGLGGGAAHNNNIIPTCDPSEDLKAMAPSLPNRSCATFGTLESCVSLRLLLSCTLKEVFAHEGELLAHFPWLLDLGDGVSGPVEYERDAAAHLWPAFTEAVSTADDWRYTDPLASSILAGLITLALPVGEDLTNRTISDLSTATDLPMWCFRAFVVMRSMLPLNYVRVLAWYLVYTRIPRDVLFHPSVPPISTLLHPEVDVGALQQTIAVVLSNVSEVDTAERIIRRFVDDICVDRTGGSGEALRRGFLCDWWALPYPMALDPVVMLYTEVLDLAPASIDLCRDTGRCITAAAVLMQSLLVNQMICPPEGREGGSDAWLHYLSSEAPFRWAPSLLANIEALCRIANRCTDIVFDGGRACDDEVLVPRSAQYVVEVLRLVLSCYAEAAGGIGLDSEAGVLVANSLARHVLFSEWTQRLLAHTDPQGLGADAAFVRHALVQIPVPAGAACAATQSGSGVFSTPTLSLIAVICRAVRGPLPMYARSFTDQIVAAYMAEANEGPTVEESTIADDGDACKSLAQEAFSILMGSLPNLGPEWGLHVFHQIKKLRPFTCVSARILSLPSCRATPQVHWELACRFSETRLIPSPIYYSSVLDTEVSVFDLASFASPISQTHSAGGSPPAAVAFVAILCELLRVPEGNEVESRLGRLCGAFECCAEASFIRQLLVPCSVVLQRAYAHLEGETGSHNGDEFYQDLLIWRASRYCGLGRDALHANLLGLMPMADSIVLGVAEALWDSSRTVINEGMEWLRTKFLTLLMSPTDDGDALVAIQELEEVEGDVRSVIQDEATLFAGRLWEVMWTEGTVSRYYAMHRVAGDALLSLRTMLMAELWERRALVLHSEHIRFQECLWMVTVGRLTEEMLVGRAAIEDEEDLSGRDAIAAQFALEDFKLQARDANEVGYDAISSADESMDWDDDTYDMGAPAVKASRAFTTERESIREALLALGLK